MMKKLLLIITLATALFSCSTSNLNSRAKNLELDMTKTEVIKVLGKTYEVKSAVKTPEGYKLEVYRFYGSVLSNDYMVSFLDGKLVEWSQIPLEGEDGRHPHPHHHDHD